MKKLFFILSLALVFTACKKKESQTTADGATAAENLPVAHTYNVTSGTVMWKGSKPVGSHSGTVNVASGTIGLDKNYALVSGDFVMNMTTIQDTEADMSDDDKAKIVGHLKSPEFFAVDSFPTAEFTITKVLPVSDMEDINYQVIGDLTLKGISHPVTVPVEVQRDGNQVTVHSKQFTIDRTVWNVRYGSKKFMDKAADNFINDDIELQIDLSASSN